MAGHSPPQEWRLRLTALARQAEAGNQFMQEIKETGYSG